jgi:hypothetical protein
LAGLALLVAGAVLLETVLARVWAAELGRHLAVPAAALPFLGAGAGGVGLYVFPGLARPPALIARLAQIAALAAAAAVAALLVTVHVEPVEILDRTVALRLAAVFLSGALPFAIVGVGVAVAVRYGPHDFGRPGAAIFAGAGLGGVAALGVLRVGGPRAGLVAAMVFALAALAFYVAASASPARVPRPRGSTVATALLATAVLFAGDLGAPWLKLPHMRWTPFERTEVQAWNEIGVVSVDRPAGGTAWMHTDGTDAMPILEAKTTIPTCADEMAYLLARDQGPVLVLGAGAGHDVRVALKYGQHEIYAVEPNEATVHTVMRDRFRKYGGDLYDKPEVRLSVDDPRAWLRGSSLRFRNIALGLPDAQHAEAIGAPAAQESRLYTVEAFRDDLDHLTLEGTLVATRWEGDLDRMLALASEALRRVGEADPARHMFACGGVRGTSLLVRRVPLGDPEISVLRDHCRKNKLTEDFAPDNPHNDLRARLTTAPDVAALAPFVATNVLPPTDDRPFFFDRLPPSGLVPMLADLRSYAPTQQGLVVLVGFAALGAAVLGLGLLVPLPLRRGPQSSSGAAGGQAALRPGPRAPSPGRAEGLVYFAALGAGGALASSALVDRLGALLGHPAFAFTTVLLALLLYAAAGSASARRVALLLAEASAGYRGQVLVSGIAVCAAVIGPVAGAALGLPFGARAALAVIVLAPFGWALGSLASLGVRLVAWRAPEILPWCWGVGGLAAFAAMPFGLLLAMGLGWTATLLAGGACLLVAAATVPRAPAHTTSEV